ncbi:4604_t:CDS:2 [Gigaspora margarita]|uniref:4604_t:CDS:1 n=1 Tax=Gigaspora margarita TaxID=4874 RepID=A0ABN7V984_GIGMA|nr:4604_t:CDS:2 [Gigaspora margarita]
MDLLKADEKRNALWQASGEDMVPLKNSAMADLLDSVGERFDGSEV